MRHRSLLITIILGISALLAACGGTPANNAANAPKTNAVNSNSNGNTAAVNVDNPVATTKKAEAPTENNAPTIGPVVQAYYAALKKKDDAAVQAVLAAAFIKSIQEDMKAEKKTGMAAYLAEYDTIPDKPVEVRNERIEGDKAVAQLKGGAYLNWTSFAFIKENGVWKFTGGSPDLDSVKQGAPAK